ncbi:MAG TPA: aldehyde dehydrogenase family protein, partial [Thermoanaerobaculia bacterium]
MAATFELIEPATGQRLATVPERTREDVDRAVRAADRSFNKGEWRKMHPRERGRVMLRLA